MKLIPYLLVLSPGALGLLQTPPGDATFGLLKDAGITIVWLYMLTRIDKVVEKSDARWQEAMHHQADHYAKLQSELTERLEEIAEDRKAANNAMLDAIRQLSQSAQRQTNWNISKQT